MAEVHEAKPQLGFYPARRSSMGFVSNLKELDQNMTSPRPQLCTAVSELQTNGNKMPVALSLQTSQKSTSQTSRPPIAIDLPPCKYPAHRPYKFFTTLLHRYGTYERIRTSISIDPYNRASFCLPYSLTKSENKFDSLSQTCVSEIQLAKAFSEAFPGPNYSDPSTPIKDSKELEKYHEIELELERLTEAIEKLALSQILTQYDLPEYQPPNVMYAIDQKIFHTVPSQNKILHNPPPAPLSSILPSSNQNRFYMNTLKHSKSTENKDKLRLMTFARFTKSSQQEGIGNYESETSPISATLERRGFGDVERAMNVMATTRFDDQRVSLKSTSK
ncbi:hypothetical protein HK096_011376 [Nowakowskiella sp. JEL0078]|nr:hypothetical protein HK096_011376 [Nowakowskiella sp. JEL0078]